MQAFHPSPLLAIAALSLLAACGSGDGASTASARTGTSRAAAPATGQAEAVFAGGCFWCMEAPFDELEGVVSTTSGYTGGELEAPTYEQVGHGQTRHVEAIRVVYDPARVSYARLLEVFWHNVDPTQDDGQFCDRGRQYRTAIFVATAEERRLATESRDRVARELSAEIVTEIRDASAFWEAEGYHQDFYRRNPLRYSSYRAGCGRDRRLRELWGDAAGH